MTLEQQNQALREEVVALKAQAEEDRHRLAQLQLALETALEEIRALKERLGLNSSNSSKPPSQDLYPQAPKEKGPPKPRGGRKGHKGHFRKLAEVANEVIACHPEACGHCAGKNVTPQKRAPWRHHVWEIPPVAVYVVEYQRHAARCGDCNKRTWGNLPRGVQGQFGVRLHSFISLCISEYRLSRRLVQGLLKTVFGLEISVGSLGDGVARRIHRALEQPTAEIEAAIERSPVVHRDETSWRQSGKKKWGWIVRGVGMTLFRIAASRGKKVAQGLIPEDYGGVVVSDRYNAYTDYARRQVCWAHLLRDFERMRQRQGLDGDLGRQLLAYGRYVFQHWHAFQRGEVPWAFLRPKLHRVRQALRACLEEAVATARKQTARTAKNILAVFKACWTFAEVEGVEPTNNAAERALRPLVIQRKISLGSQSDWGSELTERLHSVTATLKQHGKNLWESLQGLIEANWHGEIYPVCTPPT